MQREPALYGLNVVGRGERAGRTRCAERACRAFDPVGLPRKMRVGFAVQATDPCAFIDVLPTRTHRSGTLTAPCAYPRLVVAAI